MAAKNFPEIMDHIFKFEGGYVNHPSDPGGATNMGITIGTLRSFRGTAVTIADVKALKKSEAMEIYRKNYWDKISGDELPSGVDLCTMDSAVNSGPGRGAKWLQRAVGVKADGGIGTTTLSAVETADPETTIKRMCEDRMNFLKGLSTWGTFGKGWGSRVAAVEKLALKLHAEDDEPKENQPVPVTPAPSPSVELSPLTIDDYLKLIEASVAEIRKLRSA